MRQLRIGEERGRRRPATCPSRRRGRGGSRRRAACGGRLPVVALLALALRVDEDVGDVLHVADLAVAAPDLEQRVEPHRVARGRLEPPAARELPPPAGGQRPELLLDVVDEGGGLPVQQGRDDDADALARARGREDDDVLGAVVCDEPARPSEPPGLALGAAARDVARVRGLAEDDARAVEQPAPGELRRVGPARRPMRGARHLLPCRDHAVKNDREPVREGRASR